MSEWSRRRLLQAGLAATAGGAASVAGACGRSSDESATTTTSPRGLAKVDLDLSPLAAGLEVLAVDTYRQVSRMSDQLGGIPDYGAEMLKAALDHHEAHLFRWNDINRSAALGRVDTPTANLKPAVDEKLDQARSFADVARVLADLEQVLAATYLDAVGRMGSRDGLLLVGAIHIVEMQHVAAFSLAAGDFPVPDPFATTAGALRP